MKKEIWRAVFIICLVALSFVVLYHVILNAVFTAVYAAVSQAFKDFYPLVSGMW